MKKYNSRRALELHMKKYIIGRSLRLYEKIYQHPGAWAI